MKLFILSALVGSVAAFAPATSRANVQSTMTTLADAKSTLTDMATELNPQVNYWDPLKLADQEFWGQSQEATIGFLRQSEIKHGRVAMAAFVGYCVQSNFVFPWKNTMEGVDFPSANLSPEAQWDALPLVAKGQIIAFVGFLEVWDELGGRGERAHYMKGGQPGKFPSFGNFEVHPVPFDLFDPFNQSNDMDDAVKQRRLLMEINNGRLAQIGIFGFLSADAVPGSVPLLNSVAQPYDGNVMSPFTSESTDDIGSLVRLIVMSCALGTAFLRVNALKSDK